LRFWAKLGCISFGGPAGQIAIMHRELVQTRRWLSERRFAHALNYCMVLPGPEAQQLATYLGWLLHGSMGGIAAGLLFILPGLLVLPILSWVEVTEFGSRLLRPLRGLAMTDAGNDTARVTLGEPG
jgi:chromate transporter